MKFKGESNLFVRLANKRNQRLTGRKGFYFDDKGEFETDNVNMIALLKQNFEVVEGESNTDIKTNIDTDTIEETKTVEETKPKSKGRVK